MPKAAFCSQCAGYVWIAPDGSCANGHPRACLRDAHRTAGPLPPLPGRDAPAPPDRRVAAPPPTSAASRVVTPHRVNVIGRRAGAFAVDWLLGQAITYQLGKALAAALSGGGALSLWWLVVAAPVSLGALYGYFFVFEAALGLTPGKALFSLRVVDAHGKRIGWTQALKRNLARVVDLIAFGGVGLVLVAASPLRQRLGDRWGGTFVVRA